MDKHTILSEVLDYAIDFVAENQLTVAEEDLLSTVGVIFAKSFSATDDYFTEEALAKAAEVREKVAAALNKIYTEEWEQEFKRASVKPANQGVELIEGRSFVPQDRETAPAIKASIDEVLTNHPLHLLAHEMDDSGTGFDWSKCPKEIDLSFVPKEVIDEVTRRHGENYYPHVHAGESLLDSGQFYTKSVGNSLAMEFNDLHETLHRTDCMTYRKGDMGQNQIYSHLAGGGGYNYLGAEISPEFLSHIEAHHGTNWDGHALLVPILKAYSSDMTLDEAMSGGGWDIHKKAVTMSDVNRVAGNVSMISNAVGAVANKIPHPVAQAVGRVANVVGAASGAVEAATKGEAKKTPVGSPSTAPSSKYPNYQAAQDGIDPQAAPPTDPSASGADGPPQGQDPSAMIMALLQNEVQKNGGNQEEAMRSVAEKLAGQMGVSPEEAMKVIQEVVSGGSQQPPESAPSGQGGLSPEAEANTPPAGRTNPAEGLQKAQINEVIPGMQFVRGVHTVDSNGGLESLVSSFYQKSW